jgi:hypothetical protein
MSRAYACSSQINGYKCYFYRHKHLKSDHGLRGKGKLHHLLTKTAPFDESGFLQWLDLGHKIVPHDQHKDYMNNLRWLLLEKTCNMLYLGSDMLNNTRPRNISNDPPH